VDQGVPRNYFRVTAPVRYEAKRRRARRAAARRAFRITFTIEYDEATWAQHPPTYDIDQDSLREGERAGAHVRAPARRGPPPPRCAPAMILGGSLQTRRWSSRKGS